MRLIVGLGNPGKEYDKTRHNVGFMVIDKFSLKNDIKINKEKFGGIYGEKIINNEKYILLKPQSYINLSGEVIIKYINYFKIAVEDILVICDDMDLELGTYKLRYKGGSAGHNGLKNIQQHLSTNEYKRIKVGISKTTEISKADYVLGHFNEIDYKKIEIVIDKISDIIVQFNDLSFENLMNKYN